MWIEDELVRLNHQLNDYEFEEALGNTEGQEVWHSAVLGVEKCQM